MECRLKCENPDEIEFTLSITMTAKGWEKLREQLDKSELRNSHPSWELIAKINDLLAQARKVYWAVAVKTS